MKKLTEITAVFLSVTAVLSVSTGTLPAVYAAEETDLLYAPPLPAVNSQPRHQTCTALSEQAKAYYSGTYSYNNLFALTGAKDNSTSEAAANHNALYDALHTLMSETHQNYTGYSGFKAGSLTWFSGLLLGKHRRCQRKQYLHHVLFRRFRRYRKCRSQPGAYLAKEPRILPDLPGRRRSASPAAGN